MPIASQHPPFSSLLSVSMFSDAPPLPAEECVAAAPAGCPRPGPKPSSKPPAELAHPFFPDYHARLL